MSNPHGAPGPYGTPDPHAASGPYGAPGPHGAPGRYGAPSPYGAPGPHGAPGAQAAPGPYSPYAAAPPLLVMPSSVRAARITAFVMAGLSVLGTVLAAAVSGAEAAGATFGMNLCGWVVFVLALRYPTAGHGVRVASIVLASVQILLSLGGMAHRGGPSGFGFLIGSIVLVVLLSQGSAGAWFKRPRIPGPYGPGYTAP